MRALILSVLALLTILHFGHGQKIFGVLSEDAVDRSDKPLCSVDVTKIDYKKYSYLIVRWAEYNSTTNIMTSASWAGDRLGGTYDQLRSEIKRQGAKTKLLITFLYAQASQDFTKTLDDPVIRGRYVRSAVDFTRLHSFDGLMVWWPYNGWDGRGPTVLSLVSDLRAAINTTYELALHIPGFSTNAPTPPMSEFASYVDYLIVETVGYNGEWTLAAGVDVDSPLKRVQSSIQSYRSLNVTSSKMIFAIPTEGLSWILTSTNTARGAPASGMTPHGCLYEDGKLTAVEVDILITKGYKTQYDALADIFYAYGEKQWIGYENQQTFSNKVALIGTLGLGGVYLTDISDSQTIIQYVYNAVNPPVTTTTRSTSPSPTRAASGADDKVKKIVPPVVVVVCLLIAGIVVFFVLRHRKKKAQGYTAVNKFDGDQLSVYEKMPPKDGTPPVNDINVAQIKYLKKYAADEQWDTIPITELIFMDTIGKGAGGTVYRGRWRGSAVAIKRIRVESEEETASTLGEIHIMKRLRPHVNVVQFLGVSLNPEDGTLCIVTQLCDGGSLYAMLHSSRVLDLRVLENIIKGVAAGLYHLHTEGITHRDLAARNILLDKSMEGKVSDFGLSRINTSGGEAKTQSQVGPLKHMAPECLLNSVYSEKSDVWAFGVTLFEIFARTDPYTNYSPVETATRVVDTVNPLRLRATPNMTTEMKRIFLSCFETDPIARPTFSQLHADLEACGDFFYIR